jgi:hypothetical protein
MTVAMVFVMGWVFGLGARKVVRAVQNSDILGILQDCATSWYRSHRAAREDRLPRAVPHLISGLDPPPVAAQR